MQLFLLRLQIWQKLVFLHVFRLIGFRCRLINAIGSLEFLPSNHETDTWPIPDWHVLPGWHHVTCDGQLNAKHRPPSVAKHHVCNNLLHVFSGGPELAGGCRYPSHLMKSILLVWELVPRNQDKSKQSVAWRCVMSTLNYRLKNRKWVQQTICRQIQSTVTGLFEIAEGEIWQLGTIRLHGPDVWGT